MYDHISLHSASTHHPSFTEATPRERQFGMYESSPRRRRSQEAVELPLSQLHVVAAQRQLPMLLEAVPDTWAYHGVNSEPERWNIE